MGAPIQRRLFLSLLAVLLLGMGLAAGLAWLAVENQFVATLSENLLAQAELTASALWGAPLPQGAAGPETELYYQTSNVAPGVHTRLLGEQGGVLLNLEAGAGSGPLQAPQAENAVAVSAAELRQRPEIQSALGGVSATAVRRVATADNRRVLYAASPVFAADGGIAAVVYLATPLPPARLPLALILQLSGALGIAVLLAALLGAWLSRRIAQPVKALVQGASAVAAGDLEQRVPVDEGIRELHSLGGAFNHMTASLRHADQVKNAFIADVSHELRTPLTVIKGTVETLEDGALDDLEGRRPLLESMRRETERLIRLVNDLLVLTRADADALNLKLQSVDLSELARLRCQVLSGLAASREVTITIQGLAQARVWGDPDRLAQVLDNLLDNALRHAPESSAVRVSLQEHENGVQCAVSDQGPGIPPEHLPFIFERFYRLEASRSRHTGGSGLGLAIVQSLIVKQGGGVSAESPPGQGATFTFWLPANPN